MKCLKPDCSRKATTMVQRVFVNDGVSTMAFCVAHAKEVKRMKLPPDHPYKKTRFEWPSGRKTVIRHKKNKKIKKFKKLKLKLKRNA
jgi:hypothetical protein